MARRRMIDPNIWESEDFSRLSNLAKLIFIGLFSIADDEGRGKAKPIYIKSVLFPYDEKLRVTDIEESLCNIAACMSITFYEHNGNQYYQLENWTKWQRVDKPQPSKIPIPELVENGSGMIPELVENGSCLKEKKLREEKGKEEKENTAHTREGFVSFWAAYPKKKAKADAEKAFFKLKPDKELLDQMLTAIDQQKQSADWQKSGGQYIPYPATWLNQRRWEDETETEPRKERNLAGIIRV